MTIYPGQRKQCDAILRAVASAYEVSINDLRGPGRDLYIVGARFVAMHLVVTQVGLSNYAIGELFGRHHSTVANALKKAEGYLRDKPAQKAIEALRTTQERTPIDQQMRAAGAPELPLFEGARP